MKELFEEAFSEMPIEHSEEALLWEELDAAVASLEEHESALNRLINLESGTCTVLSMIQSCETDDAFAYCTGAIACINEQIEDLPLAQIVIPTTESVEAEDIQGYSVEAVGKVLKAVGGAIKKLYEAFIKMIKKFLGGADKAAKVVEKKADAEKTKLKEVKKDFVDAEVNVDFVRWFGRNKIENAAEHLNAIAKFVSGYDLNAVKASTTTAYRLGLVGHIKHSDEWGKSAAVALEKPSKFLESNFGILEDTLSREGALNISKVMAKGLNSTLDHLVGRDMHRFKPNEEFWWSKHSDLVVSFKPITGEFYSIAVSHFTTPVSGEGEPILWKNIPTSDIDAYYDAMKELAKELPGLVDIVSFLEVAGDKVVAAMKKDGSWDQDGSSLGNLVWRFPAQLAMRSTSHLARIVAILVNIRKASIAIITD